MSLILKSDIKYTGVVAARHILEFLVTAQEKTTYLKNMLSTINADSTYVTEGTAPLITDRLLAHVKKIQKKGANVLSMEYTLKAIVFITKNSLLENNYTSCSLDFGAKLNSSGGVISFYGIGDDSFTESAAPTLTKRVIQGENTLTANTNSLAYVGSDSLQSLSVGLIMGTCTAQNSATTTQDRSLSANLDEAGNPALLAYHTASRTATASSLSIVIPTTTAREGAQIEVDGGGSDVNNKAGIVVKYEYGTNQNKVYRNGANILADTGSNIMFNLSSLSVRPQVQSAYIDSGMVESWLINSNDSALANALSIHLNRQ
tara:strand:- start:3686 stop:4636 length:951 start_codon:yes stop_codon:yes gene_type:complete